MNKLSDLSVSLLVVFVVGLSSVQLKAAADDDFGRLFSRPGERKNLDILRQKQKLQVSGSQPEPQLASVADALPEPVTLQGYVKRSDGPATLWVNNKPVQENSTLDDVEIGRLSKQGNAVKNGAEILSVTIPATGKNVHLKAGQVYEPETDQIKELKLLEKEKQLNLQETGVIGNDAIP